MSSGRRSPLRADAAATDARLDAAVRVVHALVQSGRQLRRKARLSEERPERVRDVSVLLRGHCTQRSTTVQYSYTTEYTVCEALQVL